MTPGVIEEAAKLLGVQLSYVREGVENSPLVGPLRTLVFAAEKNRVFEVTPAERCTILMLSESGNPQRACFTIAGVAPNEAKELAAYLEREPRLVPALRGGELPETPFDWRGYK
jgi:hypothetical protein